MVYLCLVSLEGKLKLNVSEELCEDGSVVVLDLEHGLMFPLCFRIGDLLWYSEVKCRNRFWTDVSLHLILEISLLLLS